MEFKKYPKIHHISKEESEGILDGLCYVQEKIDGANLSIWKKDGEIRVGSRNQDVTNASFRGATEYVTTHKGIKELLDTLEGDVRLYGEWLVPHTITNYNPEAYKHFYLYDIEVDDKPLIIAKVEELARHYDIKHPEILAMLYQPIEQDLEKFIGISHLKENGKGGEGIVIKNNEYVNKFGNTTYAKIVSEKFKEENTIVFGDSRKEEYEMKIMDSYTTYGRVLKVMNKIEQTENRSLCKGDIGQIIGMTQYDIITEEAWNIQKKGRIDFKKLKGLIAKRTSRIAIAHFEGNEQSIVLEKEEKIKEKKEEKVMDVEEFMKVIDTKGANDYMSLERDN